VANNEKIRKVPISEVMDLPFECSDELIEQGIKDSIPASEAAGVFGPERQKQRLASGEGFYVSYKNGKPIYSSAPRPTDDSELEDGKKS